MSDIPLWTASNTSADVQLKYILTFNTKIPSLLLLPGPDGTLIFFNKDVLALKQAAIDTTFLYTKKVVKQLQSTQLNIV